MERRPSSLLPENGLWFDLFFIRKKVDWITKRGHTDETCHLTGHLTCGKFYSGFFSVTRSGKTMRWTCGKGAGCCGRGGGKSVFNGIVAAAIADNYSGPNQVCRKFNTGFDWVSARLAAANPKKDFLVFLI